MSLVTPAHLPAISGNWKDFFFSRTQLNELLCACDARVG